MLKKKPTPSLRRKKNSSGSIIVMRAALWQKKWKLPLVYQEIIKRHHDASIKKTGLLEVDTMGYLVRIADKIVLDASIGQAISAERYLTDLLATLGIKDTDYQNIKRRIGQTDIFDI